MPVTRGYPRAIAEEFAPDKISLHSKVATGNSAPPAIASPACLEIAMHRCVIRLLLGCCLWTTVAARAVSAPFTGAFANGVRFQGAQLTNWPDTKKPPHITVPVPGGTDRDLGSVFDAQNPVSWLFNEAAEAPSAARPGVELFGGDRLPGQVIGFRYGTESPVDRLQAHLLVKPDNEAVKTPIAVLRIKTQAVSKVVWQPRRSDRYTPATLYFLDDRQISFRALRWGAEGVTLLLPEGGTRAVAFRDIAELHLPRRDPWLNYRETLGVLSPECSNRLIRVETSRGLMVTGTLERSRMSADTHLLQPAWCLDPLGYAHKHLRWWRFSSPHEVPLSFLTPVRIEQRSPLGGVLPWQADQNVKLQPLRHGGKLYGWGLGMQSYCELEYELPDGIRAFRASVGMDDQALRTGCGRGRVYVNSTAEKPMWESKLLVGAEEGAATDRLVLKGPTQGQNRLILTADAPDTGRPAHADPLNIRSLVDWLEPSLELDPDRLRGEVLALLPDTFPAWQGWTASVTGEGRLGVSYHWDAHQAKQERFRAGSTTSGGALLLSRQIELAPKQNYLCLALSQLTDTPAGTIEVRVDGKLTAQLEVPSRDVWATPVPRFVSVKKYRGKPVKIEVELRPAKEGGAVEWHALDLLEFPDLAPWTPLEVVTARAASPGTVLVKEEAHTIFAPSKLMTVPLNDTYTIVADSNLTTITALRLELLPDARLPEHGPGRRVGNVFLSEFKVMAAPRDNPDQVEVATLTADASANHDPLSPPSAAVDGRPDTGWKPQPAGQPQAIVFTPARPIAFAAGARLTIVLESVRGGAPGRFRLLATDAAAPVPVARPGIVIEPIGRKTLFAGSREFIRLLSAGGVGSATVEPNDTPAGTASVKITGLKRTGGGELGKIPIRRDPQPGEFRFIQLAWKKSGADTIGFQLAHDGSYDPGTAKSKTPSFRYHAGPGDPWKGRSLKIDEKAPTDWVVVTRDLYADFGEFTLTGIGLSAFDGSALFNGIRLGQTMQDFDRE